MEHEQALQILPAYVDHELDVAGMLEVERHLDTCAQCRMEVEAQSAISSRLRKEAPRFATPDALLKSVSRIGQEAPVRKSSFWQWKWNINWQAAASAAVMLLALSWGINFYVAGWPRQDPLVSEVVNSHVRAMQVDHMYDVASSDQHTVKPWFNGKLDFAPPVVDLAQQGFPLAGGRLDVLDGHRVAALVYLRRRHPINVFVSAATGKHESNKMQEREGYHVQHWQSDGLDYWAVSDIPADELNSFVTLLRAGISK